MNPNQILNILNFNTIEVDRRNARGGGIAIIIEKNLFITIYYPPQNVLTYQFLNQYFSNLNKPLVVMGDFNAQHTMWGALRNLNNGIRLVDYMQDSEWVLLNDGTSTRLGNIR